MAFLPEVADELDQFIQSRPVQGIVNPPPVGTVGYQSRILEHLEVEREPRLTCLEGGGEIADTLLPGPQLREDLKARLVRQGMEQPSNLCRVRGAGRHREMVIYQ